MKILNLFCSFAVAAMIAGCASFGSLQPGRSMAEVEQQFHAPSGKRSEASGNQVWEYDLGPEGRAFWMLSFGADGRLVQAKQVLTEENFRNIRFGQSTRDDVMRLIGHPFRKYNFTNLREEVWDYRYMNGSWFMLLSVHIDLGKGTVSAYASEPDPEKYPGKDSSM